MQYCRFGDDAKVTYHGIISNLISCTLSSRVFAFFSVPDAKFGLGLGGLQRWRWRSVVGDQHGMKWKWRSLPKAFPLVIETTK
jgi:hypothetical protein